ncbi:MAG: GNAT family N-acetyltransferase [Clostridiales bacterium]|nr:GNAT family N-acetyltransferase [Clostridiales bacterium]
MSYTRGFELQKLTKHSSVDLEAKSAAIAALADEIWRDHYTTIIGKSQVDYMLTKFQSAEQILTDIQKNEYTYFTAADIKNNTLIGYCGVAPKAGYLLRSKLYVHKGHRGTGVARGFLNEAIALCRCEYDYHKIRLTVNKYNDGAIAAYKKMGFDTIDSIKTDIGGGFFMDDYVMELALP